MRMAMLLRDSPVAREVRTQLLNVVERVEPKERVRDIDKENDLLIAAFRADGYQDRFHAVDNLFHYFDDQIKELVTENKSLRKTLDEILNDARRIDFARAINCLIKAYVRKYTWNVHGLTEDYAAGWNTFYYRLRTDHGINIKARVGSGSLLSKIHEDEQIIALKVAAALAQNVGVDIVEILGELNAGEYGLLPDVA